MLVLLVSYGSRRTAHTSCLYQIEVVTLTPSAVSFVGALEAYPSSRLLIDLMLHLCKSQFSSPTEVSFRLFDSSSLVSTVTTVRKLIQT